MLFKNLGEIIGILIPDLLGYMVQLETGIPQQFLGALNPHGGQVLPDGLSGFPFEQTGKIGGCQIDVLRQLFDG